MTESLVVVNYCPSAEGVESGFVKELIEYLKTHDLGQYDGWAYDFEGKTRDLFFYGPDPNGLETVLKNILKYSSLRDWHVRVHSTNE